jgi:hypothetical protein
VLRDFVKAGTIPLAVRQQAFSRDPLMPDLHLVDLGIGHEQISGGHIEHHCNGDDLLSGEPALTLLE